MFAESSKAFIFQKFAVKVCFGLSLHIFQHGSSLSLENVCDSWCMHQTGFSSAAVVPQSKFTELCSSEAVVSQSKSTELCSSAAVLPQSISTEMWSSAWLCHKVTLPSCVTQQLLWHKVNLSRCEAGRRHLIMTCNIFGTGQTNTLTLCYLLGKAYKPAHSSATLESVKSIRSTKLLEKLLTSAAHTFHWRLLQGWCEV